MNRGWSNSVIGDIAAWLIDFTVKVALHQVDVNDAFWPPMPVLLRIRIIVL
jgi:hypothetical protein